MDVSVIIVNWNVKELILRCLRSVAAAQGQLSAEIIVVDNASADGSPDAIATAFPEVRLIRSQKNLGFARGNNTGLRYASGRYVFFLNPDSELAPDALSILIGYLDTHPEIALVAPQITNADGSFQRGSIRRDPTVASQLLISLKLQHALPHAGALQQYYYDDFDPTQEQGVDQVMGAAMCIRRSVLETVGYFDEAFFLWFEEVDLCRRLRSAGMQLRYLPRAKVIHHGGQSFKQAFPLRKQRIVNRSAVHYFYKHHGIAAALLIAATIPINLFVAWVHDLVTRYAR